MYDVVLFPTDGSEQAEAALDHAIDQAASHDATLDVLYVSSEGSPDPDVEGEAVVDAAAERARGRGVDANAAVLEGSTHDTILEYIDERDVDLVVMGTSARRGLERYLQGSVTEGLLRTVDVPVLVVPVRD